MRYLLGSLILCCSVCSLEANDYYDSITREDHMDATWDEWEELIDNIAEARYIAEPYRKTKHNEIYEIVERLFKNKSSCHYTYKELLDIQLTLFSYLENNHLEKSVEGDLWMICAYLSNASYCQFWFDLHATGCEKKSGNMDKNATYVVKHIKKDEERLYIRVMKKDRFSNLSQERIIDFTKKFEFHKKSYQICMVEAENYVTLWHPEDQDVVIKGLITAAIGTAFIPEVHIKAATIMLSVIGEYSANQVKKYKNLQNLVFQARYHAEMAKFYADILKMNK